MRILEVILQLKPKQGDITAAFIHVKLEENKSICQDYESIWAVWQTWKVKGTKVEEYSICTLSEP